MIICMNQLSLEDIKGNILVRDKIYILKLSLMLFNGEFSIKNHFTTTIFYYN